MTYIFHTDYDLNKIDEFVINSEQNSLFQCSNWADIKSNWQSLHTCVTENDEIVASALILIRKLIFGKTICYVPRGPVMDYHNKELVSFVLDNIVDIAKNNNAAMVKFDPSITTKVYSYKDRDKDIALNNFDVIETLKEYGCKHKGFTKQIIEATQPRYNGMMIVEDNFLEQLEHKTRKCINTSIRRGVTVEEAKQDLSDFAQAIHYTEERKKVALRDKEYFENMMKVYGDKSLCYVSYLDVSNQIEKTEDKIKQVIEDLHREGLSKKEKNLLNQTFTQLEKDKELLLSSKDSGKIITGGILAVYNDNLMELLYMGNHIDYLWTYSSYLLYEKCLEYCVEHGIKKCSFGGIEGTLDDGLTLFKSNWLLNVEEYIGEFNIVLDSFVFNLFDNIYPKFLTFVGKIR